MKLNVKAMAIAHGTVAGMLFVLCRVVFMLAPEGSLAAMKYLFHTDWSSVAAPVNWGGFLLGLVLLMLFAGLVGATLGSIYNWMARESAVRSPNPSPTEKLAYQNLHLE